MTAAPDQPRLDTWLSALAHADRCPWPGPRPFNPEDPPEQLVGRERDSERFRHVVEQHRLIFLTGASGVGKTSLLEAGLVRALESSGRMVLVCREWSGKQATASAVSFLVEKVSWALARKQMKQRPDPTLGSYSSDRRLFWELRDDYGANVILILDQFEELIRYTPSLRDELFDVLAEINARLPLKVVISFRDEYMLQLRPLQRRAQPFSIAEYVLEEVHPRHVRDLIASANRDGEPEAISGDAADHLVAVWNAARASVDADVDFNPLLRIGLLHLQALLYTLHDRTGGSFVTIADVEAFARDRPGAALFLAGLDLSIDVKLERCRTAGRDAGLDAYLVEGAAHIVARLVRHLSSAGYKLVRGAHDLAQATMGTEFEILRRGVRCDAWSFTALLDAMIGSISAHYSLARGEIRLLDDDRRVIARDADRRRSRLTATRPLGDDWETSVEKGRSPEVADPENLTSGPMRGLTPTAVLIEELRRFVFALLWLAQTSLVRLSSPGSGGLMVSLIHDGFGEALLAWSDGQLQRPQGPLHAITGSHGDSFNWKHATSSGNRPDTMLSNEVPRVISNLRWRGSGLQADLRRVVFVNCDFRSAFFHDCHLDGVTFVNCMLENTVLMNCEISEGDAADERILARQQMRQSGLEPIFQVPPAGMDASGAEQSALQIAADYRGIEGDHFRFLAQVPDLPAIPVAVLDGEDLADWAPRLGGMAIYGSRVSSMVIRYCTGDVGLHRCNGDGFGVDDHGGGHLVLDGCTLRQVRITAGQAAPRVNIHCSDSSLAQVWLGDGLRGELVVERGTLLQVWNESPTLDASATDAAVYGTIGVRLFECSPMPGIHDLQGRREIIRSEDIFDATPTAGDLPAER